MKDNWTTKPLGEICVPINSGLWKGKKAPFINIKVIRGANFTKDCHLDLTKDVVSIDAEQRHFEQKKLQKGDLIIEKSGGTDTQPVGRTVLFDLDDGNYSFSNFTAVCRVKNPQIISPLFVQKYLYLLYMNGYTKKIQSNTTNLHNLNFDEFLKIPVPIPPIEEQQRIIEKTENFDTQYRKVKANLEKEVSLCQSLFENTLKQELQAKEGTCTIKKIGDFCDTASGGTPLKSIEHYYTNGNIPWLRSGEVCKKYITETELSITEEGLKNSSATWFKENSIVMAMYGATAGQVGILKIPTTTNQAVCGIFPKIDIVSEYLYYYLLNEKNSIVAKAEGQAQPNISQQKIKDIEVIIPDKETQIKIVQRIEAFEKEKEKLLYNYKQQAESLEQLKENFLKEVFE